LKEAQHIATVVCYRTILSFVYKIFSGYKPCHLVRNQTRGRSGHSYIIALMMGTEMVSETSVIFYQLTQLIAREYFINVSRRESSLDHRLSLIFLTILYQLPKLLTYWKLHDEWIHTCFVLSAVNDCLDCLGYLAPNVIRGWLIIL
jgi:hypothetical protein